MQECYITINLDKNQALDPFQFCDGYNSLELGCWEMGRALDLLLAARGADAVDSDSQLVGSWAGDRVIFASDFTARDDAQGWCKEHDRPIYNCVQGNIFDNSGTQHIVEISLQVIEALRTGGRPSIRWPFSDQYTWQRSVVPSRN